MLQAQEVDLVKAEVKNGHSRLDYMLEKDNKKIWVEVKGVSLSVNNRAIFPDAPSERATKHLNTLMDIKKTAFVKTVFIISIYFYQNYG